MKELSIEEKAKRYNEAIEKAVKIHNEHKAQSFDVMLKVFPELKESEDERMKKIISDILLIDSDEIREILDANNVLMQDIDAWLRKQSKKDEEILILKDQIESLHAAIKALKETHKIELKKQSEQKPIDKIQLGKKYKCIASPRYSTFMRGEIYKPEDKFLCNLMNFCSDCFELVEDDEQKPVEKWYDFIRWFVKQRTNDYTLIPSDDDIHKWGDNILNHARKVLEQNTAEWSEEDDEMYKKIETAIDSYYAPFSRDAEEMSEWFKNLKDRVQPYNTWKPSKEQITWLYRAADETSKDSRMKQILNELLSDLKKLRGE